VAKDEGVYFLLVFSFDEGRLIDQDEYRDRLEAIAPYDAAETQYRGKLDRFEVVLIGADSIETVMKTHGHYLMARPRCDSRRRDLPGDGWGLYVGHDFPFQPKPTSSARRRINCAYQKPSSPLMVAK
jgi:hypothetical protein